MQGKETASMQPLSRAFAKAGGPEAPGAGPGSGPPRGPIRGGTLVLLAALVLAGCSRKEPEKGSRRPAPPPVEPRAPAPPGTEAAGMLEGYMLVEPDERHELPDVLREVSGLTEVSDSEVACVQDEQGAIFIYHMEMRRIERTIAFGGPGDYEGLALVGSTFFVLRSDGVLIAVAENASESPRIEVADLGLPTRDNEGLCHDPLGRRLLVAPKSLLEKKGDQGRRQGLFAVGLEDRRAGSTPCIVLDLSAVFDGRERTRTTKRGIGRALPSRFLPSSVAVHPRSGRVFVLSAVAGNLAVFGRDGRLQGQCPLDRSLFPQPEGIAFLPGGDLVIANEGGAGHATLLRFKPGG